MSEISCIIVCKVTPKASKSEVLGWDGSFLKVRLAAVPEKGQANDELVRLLSKILNIAKSRVVVASGMTSRFKRVSIHGMEQGECLDQLLGKR